jgi:hypothetical protein
VAEGNPVGDFHLRYAVRNHSGDFHLRYAVGNHSGEVIPLDFVELTLPRLGSSLVS